MELNPILARALAKDPAARFQSGKDFLGALAEFRTRHAEMEMLKDLGEMVAQAENLGPVSAVESKQNPLPATPQATAAGGGSKLVALGSRGRRARAWRTLRGGDGATSTRPSSGRHPRGLDSSIPDWSLDTDALKSPAEREAASKREREAAEPVPSSPGTLISDLQSRKAKKAPAPPPAPTPIFNEENRPTERIQTIPGPAPASRVPGREDLDRRDPPAAGVRAAAGLRDPDAPARGPSPERAGRAARHRAADTGEGRPAPRTGRRVRSADARRAAFRRCRRADARRSAKDAGAAGGSSPARVRRRRCRRAGRPRR